MAYNIKRAETMRRVLAERGGMVNSGRTRFKAGVASWNKGKKLSPDHIAKLSAAKIGKAPPNKGKPGLAKENNPNWKGGITTQDKLLRTEFRDKMQHLVFARDNYTCQVCEATGNLQVDHIKKWADYPELRFDIDNCRTLCMACHYYITFKKKIPQGIVWGHNLSKRVTS